MKSGVRAMRLVGLVLLTAAGMGVGGGCQSERMSPAQANLDVAGMPAKIDAVAIDAPGKWKLQMPAKLEHWGDRQTISAGWVNETGNLLHVDVVVYPTIGDAQKEVSHSVDNAITPAYELKGQKGVYLLDEGTSSCMLIGRRGRVEVNILSAAGRDTAIALLNAIGHFVPP